MMAKPQPEKQASGGRSSSLVTFLADKVVQQSAPFAVWLAEWPVAWLAHLQWGGSPWASMGLTLSAVGITGATLWSGIEASMKRHRLVQAVATSAAASGWFAAAAIGGPTTELAVNTWLMGGPTVALLWSVKKAMRTNPDTAATSDNSEEKSLLAKIGLGRSQAKQIKVAPNKVTVPVEFDRGKQTHDDAAKAAKSLAGIAGVPENAVRWERDPEDAGQGQFVIVPEDMLKTPTPWPGPSAPGGSIGDAPILAGIYEDGPRADLWFCGDQNKGRNATNWQLMGMTGAGKSQGGRGTLTDLMTRRDVAVIALDPSKGVQTFGPLLGGIEWAAFTLAECRAVLNSLPAMITARANELGRHGYDEWTPEAGAKLNMPYLVVWCEEVAKLFREGEDLLPIIQEIRSAGGSLVFSLQRSSHTVMDTDVRANIAGGVSFGVNSAVDAGFVLSDDTIDAGARPEQWKNLKPGYCYIEGPGIPEERFATPVRTYLLDKEHAAQTIAAHSGVRYKGLGPVTEKAAGQAYRNRTRYTSISQAAAAHENVQAADDGPDLDAEDMALHDTDPEYADIPINIDRPLPPVPDGMDVPFSQPHGDGEVSREKSLQALEDVLNEFIDEGKLEFGPIDLTPHLQRIGKSSSWVRKEFRRLEADGQLSTTDRAGVYRINVAQAA